jgi:predicted transcriptional regulator of viral defense system
MNFEEFKKKAQQFPFVLAKEALKLEKNTQLMKNQLTRWEKKGLIIKLKRGIYLLNRYDRKVTPSRFYLANQLYEPSYISLESALSLYGIIPEQTASITSVASKKTTRFKNEFGDFIYQHIKPQAFKGFILLREENGLESFVAKPEKAVVDFLYLHLKEFGSEPMEKLRESYRFQNLDTLKRGLLIEFSRLFVNAKLTKICALLFNLIKEEQLK